MKWLKRLLCKHEWEERGERIKVLEFSEGEIYIVCSKCEKIKGSYFKRH